MTILHKTSAHELDMRHFGDWAAHTQSSFKQLGFCFRKKKDNGLNA